MKQAADIMNNNPPYCEAETAIGTLVSRFSDKSISGILVVDSERRLLGVITETDLIDRQASLHIPTALAVFDMVISLGEQRFEREVARLNAKTAGDLLDATPTTIAPDTSLEAIASLMEDSHIHHLPVVDSANIIVGMVTKRELIRALIQRPSQ